MIELTLPYPISANRYWKSRVMTVHGKPMPQTYVSKEAKEFKEHVGCLARAAGVRCRWCDPAMPSAAARAACR